MEITNITIHQYNLPLAEPFVTSMRPIHNLGRVLVEMETSSGIIGYGEAAPAHEVTGETRKSTTAVLTDVLGPYVLGKDPLALDSLTDDLWRYVDGAPAAHAAVELACQDIRGKATDMPVYRLLGGTGDIATVTVPAILSIGPPDEMVANAKEAVDNGYEQIKIKVGDDTETDIERIQQVVTAVPEDVSVKVDVNQAWGDAATALSVINRIPDKVAALEQPVAPENVDDLALLRERSIIPIMPDESFETAANVVNLIKRGAGDIYNMKLMKTGGISGAIQLNAVAEADHRPTQLGSMVEGHVGTAAGVHIVHALDNVVWNELVGPFKTTDSIGDLETDQPEIRVKGPGLGVDINRDDLKRLRTDRITID